MGAPSREIAIAALRLVRAKGVGSVTYRRLVAHCGGVVQAVAQVEDLCRAYNRKPIVPISQKDAEKELDAATQAGAQLLVFGEAGYPELLAHIPDPPPVLTVLGNPEMLHQAAIAIVGSRNASVAGKAFTTELVQTWCAAGFTIISGLARGIDTAAHTAALQAGGHTIAVVAGGADHIYPPENKALREEIITSGRGCIISENAWGSKPTAQHFPNRNRLIAGLSQAVCVTEASRHSGSLITARQAGQQGRDVFAVPGAPSDPRAQGPNHLIKQGAYVLETAEDVLEVLRSNGVANGQAGQGLFQPRATKTYVREEDTQTELFNAQPTTTADEVATEPVALDDALPTTDEEKLLSALSATPVAIDALLRQITLPEHTAMLLLSDLELSGRITRTVLGEVRLA